MFFFRTWQRRYFAGQQPMMRVEGGRGVAVEQMRSRMRMRTRRGMARHTDQ